MPAIEPLATMKMAAWRKFKGFKNAPEKNMLRWLVHLLADGQSLESPAARVAQLQALIGKSQNGDDASTLWLQSCNREAEAVDGRCAASEESVPVRGGRAHVFTRPRPQGWFLLSAQRYLRL